MPKDDSRRVLLLGASGLLGREIFEWVKHASFLIDAPSSRELSLTDLEGLRQHIASSQPDIVINAAAFTDVDGSEVNPANAFTVNTDAVGVMLRCAREQEFRIVHVSTASVFTGSRGQRFARNSVLNPTNSYNVSKTAAEQLCFQALGDGVNVSWVRTYWLYGSGRRTFVEFVADRLRAGTRISVVEDQYGQPTLATDLAAVIGSLAFEKGLLGPIHGVNSGSTSRLAWAHRIAEVLDLDASLIDAVSASDFDAAAPRPTSCVLEEDQEFAIGLPMRPWEEALKEYLMGRDVPS